MLDAHPLFRAAFCRVLEATFPAYRIHVFEESTALIQHLERLPASLIIYDLLASKALGITGLGYLSARNPHTRIVALGSTEIPTGEAFRRRTGLSGLLSKTATQEEIVQALRRVMREAPALPEREPGDDVEDGCYWRALDKIRQLSPKRYRILSMIAEGRLNKEIAWEVGASEATIKGVVTTFLKMLNLKTRTEIAVLIARFEKDAFLGLGMPLSIARAAAS